MPRKAEIRPPKPPRPASDRRGRKNPRIETQREVLNTLLSQIPDYTAFNRKELEHWQAMGMGPLFYLYNGMNTVTRIIDSMLDDLEKQEQAWKEQRGITERTEDV